MILQFVFFICDSLLFNRLIIIIIIIHSFLYRHKVVTSEAVSDESRQCKCLCRSVEMWSLLSVVDLCDSADSQVRLQLLVEDTYCGLLIGRHGRAMHQLRQRTSTRISVSK